MYVCHTTSSGDVLLIDDLQVETWASNANIFVAQEDDDTQPYSVRVAGFDLLDVSIANLFRRTCRLTFLFLQSLLERNPASVSGAFQDHLSSIAQSAQQARESGKADWYVYPYPTSSSTLTELTGGDHSKLP